MCKAAVRNWVEIEPRVREWANKLAKQLRKADALEGNRILVRVPIPFREGDLRSSRTRYLTLVGALSGSLPNMLEHNDLSLT
jgi:hypothetical protein